MSEERRARIESKLRERLDAAHVEVADESHLHAGHAGAREGGGHFRAVIVSDRFEGKNRVAAQREVYAALEDEMGAHIHALAMTTLTPAQWKEQGGG
ncbi:MAG: BolA family protein [Myxococcota bacterium]|nr:BolA family protein [Myxococcota bacterium]